MSGHHAAGDRYDRHYFETALGPLPYDRQHGEWLQFFATIADHIATEIKPKRVLDVGCAKGFLVEALRDRGVEAFGIDISEYALGEVRADIRPYCRLASVVDPLEDEYDLIACIEVIEHLGEEEGRRAIANICQSTGDVLFSSTPDDFTEPTHVNVRPVSWWIEQFAGQGFHPDVEFDAGFVAAHALRFRAAPASVSALDAVLVQRHRLLRQLAALRIDVEGKDGAIANLHGAVDAQQARGVRLQSDLAAVQRGAEALRHELAARRLELGAVRHQVEARDQAIGELHTEVDHLTAEAAGLHRAVEDKDKLIAGLNYHLLALQRTVGWKILERLRRVRDRLMPADSRRRDLYWRIRRPLEVLLDEGLWSFLRKTRYKIRLRWQGQEFLVKAPPQDTAPNLEVQYQLWVERHRLNPHDVASMKAAVEAFAYTPVISIVTPVYNTDEVWLRKAIESVRAQIYPHWELCLVNDGSTKPHVRAVLDEYVALEPRVWVKHLSRNHGIAGASGHGLGLATGEFVALLDHDDELPPEALFEVAKALNEEPDLDLIYTDEDKLDPDGRRVEPFFKPDWSPDLLLSMNYITHLSVFRRSLLGEIGGFRLGLDGSQDYDLLLRFTERARRIAHLPKILYHWRKAPGSAAASPAAKPFAYEAARQAIEDAVRRRGHDASVVSVLPGLYTVRYRLAVSPLVSIIIPTRDRWSLLQQCLRSIEEKTSYARYEIIVLDNDSTEPESLRGLNAIADRWRVFPFPGPFNFSALNNFGAAQARGEYFVFLNNDTQVIEPDWLSAMLEQAQRHDVGAVGARLHYPDGRIQHAGLVLGVGGIADHAFKGLPGNAFTYFALGDVARNVSAVTAACMMVPRRAFEEAKGFDERLQVALNDVDLCLRLRQLGYLIVYTPFALLYHHESGTRGRLHPPGDEELVWNQWGDLIRKGDPYYNPNLTLSRTDWSLGG
ncbi:MAG TPA: glycosyltransferase [Methylomirabilota bacterium]|jgi:GT2 family glycosyltransferase/SAM-dependent methyltransferase|nr:glycosyltransferase [Methylomirabilota bacterium]